MERTASAADIKKAYYDLARKYHPDLHQNADYFIERFNEVNEAYRVLGNLDSRLDYALQLYMHEELREEAKKKLRAMQREMQREMKRKSKKNQEEE